jgi:hypothetical protein
MAIVPAIVAILGAAQPILERFFPDPVKREEFKLAMLQAEQAGQLEEAKLQLSAILAEAQSTDPWTSRARPTFLYIVYLFLLAAFPMGILFAFLPDVANSVAAGVRAWLLALPEPVWWLFGAGYLGYTGGRSFDKWQAARKGK